MTMGRTDLEAARLEAGIEAARRAQAVEASRAQAEDVRAPGPVPPPAVRPRPVPGSTARPANVIQQQQLHRAFAGQAEAASEKGDGILFEPLAGPRALGALIEKGNIASRGFDVIPGPGQFRPFEELNRSAIATVRILDDAAERQAAKGRVPLAVALASLADIENVLALRGAADVALLAGPSALSKAGKLTKPAAALGARRVRAFSTGVREGVKEAARNAPGTRSTAGFGVIDQPRAGVYRIYRGTSQGKRATRPAEEYWTTSRAEAEYYASATTGAGHSGRRVVEYLDIPASSPLGQGLARDSITLQANPDRLSAALRGGGGGTLHRVLPKELSETGRVLRKVKPLKGYAGVGGVEVRPGVMISEAEDAAFWKNVGRNRARAIKTEAAFERARKAATVRQDAAGRVVKTARPRQRGAAYVGTPLGKGARATAPKAAPRRVEVAERPVVDLESVNKGLAARTRERVAEAFKTLERSRQAGEAPEVSTVRFRRPLPDPGDVPYQALPEDNPFRMGSAVVLEASTTAGTQAVVAYSRIAGSLNPASRARVATAVKEAAAQSTAPLIRVPAIIVPASEGDSPRVGYVEVNTAGADLDRLPLTEIERQAIVKSRAGTGVSAIAGTNVRTGAGVASALDLAPETSTRTGPANETRTRTDTATETETAVREQPATEQPPRVVRKGRGVVEVELPEGPEGARYPSQVALRMGNTEERIRARGPLEFAQDLSSEVPNDITAKPWDTIVVEKYSKIPVSRKDDLGVVKQQLRGRRLTFSYRPEVARRHTRL